MSMRNFIAPTGQSVHVKTRSASRLLYICRWLNDESEAMKHFETVIFNLANVFFVVFKSGAVHCMGIAPWDTSNALMLLDPCLYLSGAQKISCKMLIVFSSQ
jgi:hypothetical protein